MKPTTLLYACSCLISLLLPALAIAQHISPLQSSESTLSQAIYEPVTVSGFNADVVCNTSSCNASATLDANWLFYSSVKKVSGSLPQQLQSKLGIDYQLAPFDSNNALTIGSNGSTSGVLTLTNPVNAKELWLLGLSASGRKDIQVQITYADNSTSANYNISFPDWYQTTGSTAAFYGLGRINTSGNYDGREQFGLFEQIIPADELKQVKSIRFQYTGTDQTYTSIFAVTAYKGGRLQDKELYMISNAHLDTQWDWDVQTTIDQYVKNTLTGNFNLVEKYPNYKFNFEGAIKYMFAKEYYPELYEQLKTYIAAGRWHVSGTSVDANDVMVPSAESIIRNHLLGYSFFKKEFNVDGGNDIMLPDCFGFPYSLPTLAAHCGITGFHSQKLSWGSAFNYDALPHFGLWRGIDGSEIYAIHKPGAYVTQYRENLSYNGSVLNEIIANENQLGTAKTVRYFGTGDRGGSVDESTADWLEKGIASDGPVKVKVVTPDEFFNSITPEERASLPVWDNELPMKTHGVGCYTSQTILKYWNRKGELLADATEKSSVVANWLGGLPYQQKSINDAWIRLLWHQFHDDLTGTSIPGAYVNTYNDHVTGLLALSSTLTNAVGAVAREMDTRVEGIPLLIHNPLSVEREDIVEAKIALESQPSAISVFDPAGNPVAVQVLDYTNGVLHFLFKATLPSLGYATYELRPGSTASATLPSTLKITQNTIENDQYLVKINPNGDVYSITDKQQSNKELLSSPIRLTLQRNSPGYWASWEISWNDIAGFPRAYVDENVNISIEENGPLRASLRVSRTKNGSEFVQFIRVTNGVNDSRIDFVNEVEWQTRETLLKVIFPLTASAPQASYDSSIGAVKRGNNHGDLYEVAGHQWADLTHADNSFGISIFNDSKYGWDKPANNQLRLTLIHTPATGNDRTYEKYQDLGLNKFTYSFYRHTGKWNESTQWEASKLNQPLLAFEVPKKEGRLGKNFGFASLNTGTVAIKALKKAEESDEIVVRVYELTGEAHPNTEISFATGIVSAREVNGREQPVGPVTFEGNKLKFDISGFQPRTFAVKLADHHSEKQTAPTSLNAELPYNTDVFSTDDLKRDGRFGTSYYVYPAELIPEEIIADGIRFKTGPVANGQLNAVRCEGQEITIPQSATNRKLYILAASQKPDGSAVMFKTGASSHPVKVEYFAGHAGTWGTVYTDQRFRTDNIAFMATHRHNYSLNRNDAYEFLYIYRYTLDIDENTTTLTLPQDNNVMVFAVTASDNRNDDVKTLGDIQFLPDYEYLEKPGEADACGERLIPNTISASGRTSYTEHESNVADNNSATKWSHSSTGAKFIQYTFDTEVDICQWKVIHAGIENDDRITSGYSLQYRNNANLWENVDEVTNNTLYKTSRSITPVRTKTIRLLITKPQQNNDNVARIYTFDVFGSVATGIAPVEIYNNFTTLVGRDRKLTVKVTDSNTEYNNDIQLFDSSGRLLLNGKITSNEWTTDRALSPGMYIVKLGNEAQKIVVL